jgi:CRP-like cAMP-binding protein
MVMCTTTLKATYRSHLMRIMMRKRTKFLKYLTCPGTKVQALFAQLDALEVQAVCSTLEPVEYTHEQVVMLEGELTNDFYMVVKGEAKVFIEAMKCNSNPTGYVCTLEAGTFFGETSLVTDQPRTVLLPL